MGINIGEQEVSNIFIGTSSDILVYVGQEQIWPTLDDTTISNGFWIDEFPWDDNSYWYD